MGEMLCCLFRAGKVIYQININIKKTLLAFIVCLVAIPLARFISPQTVIDGNNSD
jgi:thiamine transporter ThiT